ncbi:MAG: 3-isopropylmalate dehydratase small subunit [Chloroflexi bacterium]|nr:3-isopropylmalate dehydratase small subunit [Chloroflexota bacterium]
MQAFVRHSGGVVPLDGVNVDTDQIIPKQFLKRIERTGYGQFLFYDWRLNEDGTPKPEFELNRPGYEQATILVAGRNFGCGSSREHAPWALLDHGFRVVIAPSFADIFYSNCLQNGLLPIVLPEETVRTILDRAKAQPGYQLTVDLEKQEVADAQGLRVSFEIDAFRRYCLLNGLDDIGLTLQQEGAIRGYEERQPPWRSGQRQPLPAV